MALSREVLPCFCGELSVEAGRVHAWVFHPRREMVEMFGEDTSRKLYLRVSFMLTRSSVRGWKWCWSTGMRNGGSA